MDKKMKDVISSTASSRKKRASYLQHEEQKKVRLKVVIIYSNF